MEDDKSTAVTCTILAIDHSNCYYRACAVCERPLPDDSTTGVLSSCKFCDFRAFNSVSSGSIRLFRILMSIATDTKVLTVICFDKVARVLFGCSADEFFDFAKLHPFSGETVDKILEGEMFQMTLSKPQNGNAQHLRVVSAVPLRSRFQPAIEALREHYGSRDGS
ncbi:hypothetical protein L6164_022020 [Bauhinia variegata]|uniref:Uncharacterized protein n=1 Tax=Bauhinia variegata TaxID=167791 RepID=A0ACB9MEB0_BAUVA|nr:hypothetical protein L6164_022020 [Bauhinia variegata]